MKISFLNCFAQNCERWTSLWIFLSLQNIADQEVTKWQIFSSKHLQQVEPVLFTEVGCGGCNVASYVFKPSASTPPSHSPPDLFNEKAEKLVLQEIVFQFEFYKKKLCSQYFVQNKTRFTFSPIELKSKFLSLSAFIHWLPKEGVDRTSGLKKILSLQRFWRIVSSLIKWSSHKHDWFSCKSVAQAKYYSQFYYRRREMLISCWLPLW